MKRTLLGATAFALATGWVPLLAQGGPMTDKPNGDLIAQAQYC